MPIFTFSLLFYIQSFYVGSFLTFCLLMFWHSMFSLSTFSLSTFSLATFSPLMFSLSAFSLLMFSRWITYSGNWFELRATFLMISLATGLKQQVYKYWQICENQVVLKHTYHLENCDNFLDGIISKGKTFILDSGGRKNTDDSFTHTHRPNSSLNEFWELRCEILKN